MSAATIPTTDSTTGARLSELLDAELGYDPVARGGYNSHTAMALVAAWRLGATADQLDEWFQSDVDSGFLIPREVPAEVASLRSAVERDGAAAVIQASAGSLVPSPGAQFFHAPIRLEYGIDAGDAGQVANAIHNWRQHPDERDDLPAVSGQQTLDEIAAVAAAAHVSGNNIASLHLVTGTRAVRVIAPTVDEASRQFLIERTAQAVAAMLPRAAGKLADQRERAELDELRQSAVPGWTDIASAAINSGDPHVVKLAYTASREQQITGDPLYQWLAARQSGLA